MNTNKMFKKVIPIILAAVMLANVSGPAFAQTQSGINAAWEKYDTITTHGVVFQLGNTSDKLPLGKESRFKAEFDLLNKQLNDLKTVLDPALETYMKDKQVEYWWADYQNILCFDSYDHKVFPWTVLIGSRIIRHPEERSNIFGVGAMPIYVAVDIVSNVLTVIINTAHDAQALQYNAGLEVVYQIYSGPFEKICDAAQKECNAAKELRPADLTQKELSAFYTQLKTLNAGLKYIMLEYDVHEDNGRLLKQTKKLFGGKKLDAPAQDTRTSFNDNINLDEAFKNFNEETANTDIPVQNIDQMFKTYGGFQNYGS